MKGLAIILGLLATCVLAVGSAQAKPGSGDRKIVAAVQDIGFEPPTAACELGTITFSLVGLDGRPKGTGVSCIHSIVGCDPFFVGCQATALVDFTLTFAQGSITAPVVIKEVWRTETTVAQRVKGRISSGTGAFTDARGSIKCRGGLQFTETGVIPNLICVVRVRQDD